MQYDAPIRSLDALLQEQGYLQNEGQQTNLQSSPPAVQADRQRPGLAIATSVKQGTRQVCRDGFLCTADKTEAAWPCHHRLCQAGQQTSLQRQIPL